MKPSSIGDTADSNVKVNMSELGPLSLITMAFPLMKAHSLQGNNTKYSHNVASQPMTSLTSSVSLDR